MKENDVDEDNLEQSVEPASVRRAKALIVSLRAKMDDRKKTLAAQEQQLRAAQAVLQRHNKTTQRKKRTRRLSHAGGMMEMTGLLEYRFVDGSTSDNPQDDLRANLLVGALLQLAEQLSVAPADQLHALAERGQAYRETAKARRRVPLLNPFILLGESATEG